MYLLDTNVVSELRRRAPHGAVLAWLDSVSDLHLHLSAFTFAELQGGAERARKTDPGKAMELEAWIDLMPARFKILPMDHQIFRIWARLMSGKPQQLYSDGMIAATAKHHKLTVVTRNVRDYTSFGVNLLNPFDPLAASTP